ncbi:MAG: IS3 family transposase [Planctomycetota bacterium]
MLTDCFAVSQRRACKLLGQPRATQRYLPSVRYDEAPLTRRIIELASMFGRYGYRRITALLRREGWWVPPHRALTSGSNASGFGKG